MKKNLENKVKRTDSIERQHCAHVYTTNPERTYTIERRPKEGKKKSSSRAAAPTAYIPLSRPIQLLLLNTAIVLFTVNPYLLYGATSKQLDRSLSTTPVSLFTIPLYRHWPLFRHGSIHYRTQSLYCTAQQAKPGAAVTCTAGHCPRQQ